MRVKRRIIYACTLVLIPIVGCSFVLISCIGWNAPRADVNWVSYEPKIFINNIAISAQDYESAQMDITDIHGNVVRAIPFLFTPNTDIGISVVDDETNFDDFGSVFGNRVFLAGKLKNNKSKGYFVATNITKDELFGFKYKTITFYRVD